eukprot:CAMPEP_0170473564 /NCGR_PEP_ID=MMETSP0123-20130129/15465_1 /TAXON_ID=182087 /ORGANISM="Favella ehrenbergii, Strain Fehren 1" /LENGTH=105 /DNA_ID=CAMNT_0010742701 /DNA_START=160 /DNA_END=477 /DNA_ORIENTATION=-
MSSSLSSFGNARRFRYDRRPESPGPGPGAYKEHNSFQYLQKSPKVSIPKARSPHYDEEQHARYSSKYRYSSLGVGDSDGHYRSPSASALRSFQAGELKRPSRHLK